MKKQFKNITKIESKELFNQVSTYCDNLINEATANGSLDEQGADNAYTREIGRVSNLCADYETNFITFKALKFKSPLVNNIEEELAKRALKQRQAAELLDVKETSFSQILSGKRRVSMRLAKQLYKVFNIDPKLILEYA
jgi:predicted XRE-type DNA-binding protein